MSIRSRIPYLALWAASLVAAFGVGLWLGDQRKPALASAAPPVAHLLGDVAINERSSAPAKFAAKGKDAQHLVMDALAHAQAGLLNQSDVIKAFSILQEVAAEDLPEALAFLEARAAGPRQQSVMIALVSRWAEFEPAKALAYTMERFQGQQRRAGLSSVMAAWAAKDPNAALKWFEENQNDDGREVMGVIFGSLARNDLNAAMTKLAALDPQDRGLAISGLARLAFDDDRRDEVLRRVRELPDAGLRELASRQLVDQWAQFDPQAAARWVDEQALNEAEKSTLQESVVDVWLQTDPKTAANWIMEHGESEDTASKINQIVSAWVYQSPNEAAEWMAQFPPGQAIDDGLTTLAFGIMRRDCESAFAWASRITDDAKRIGVLRNVYLEWHRRDAAAASASLQRSAIAASEAEQLKRTAASQPR